MGVTTRSTPSSRKCATPGPGAGAQGAEAVEAVAGAIGGLGLFIVGMRLLTENLETLANRRVRLAVSAWTENRVSALLWGALAGSITQSMPALTFIVVSILRSGMVDVGRALTIILGGCVGVSTLVFIVTLDAKAVALCTFGLAGAVLVSERTARYRPLAAALFGAAMIVFGLIVLKDAAAPLAGQPWFADMIQRTGHSLALAFLAAVLLTALVQCASAVAVLGIGMATAGAISVDQAIMMLFGCGIGSGLVLYVLSVHLTGRARQIAMYTLLYNVWICALLLPLLYLELHLDIPLLKAFVLSLDAELDRQLAVLFVLIACVPLPILLIAVRPSITVLERLWPPSAVDDLARPRFIHDRTAADAGTSLRLVGLEQRRWLRTVSRYFDSAREGGDVAPVREAARKVLCEVDELLEELQAETPTQAVEDRMTAMNRQKLLWRLEESAGALCGALAEPSDGSVLDGFHATVCESVDAVLLALIDAIEAGDELSWGFAHKLTGDRAGMMRKIRTHHLTFEPPLGSADVVSVLLITRTVEEIFGVLSKVGAAFSVEADGQDSIERSREGYGNPHRLPYPQPRPCSTTTS